MANCPFFLTVIILLIPGLIDACTRIGGRSMENNTTSGGLKGTTDSIKVNMVALINCYRSCHSVNPLTRDTGIEASQSDYWAQHLASTNSFQHSNSKYGENLYGGRVSDSGAEAINMWYFECFGRYTYNSENNPFSCGHFTALVWKSSSYIGLGMAKSSSYGYIVVANFDPPGNYMGQYSKNVPSPDPTCVQSCKGGGRS